MENPTARRRPEKHQEPNSNLHLRSYGRCLKLGSWIFSRAWILVLGALVLLPGVCFAQRQIEGRPAPLDPVTAEREARSLVADMLSQKPVQTNTGILKIRDSNGQQREIPIRFEIWSTSDSSTSIYEAKDPGPPQRDLKLTVIHTDAHPNQYLLSQDNAPAKKFSGTEAMLPFAGSDFWVADLGLEFLHWPQQRLLKKEMRRSRFCDVLESTEPHPAPEGYSRVISWVEHEQPHGIVHADAYDARGELLKRFDPTEFEKIQGEYQLQEMEIRNRKTGSRAWITFDLQEK